MKYDRMTNKELAVFFGTQIQNLRLNRKLRQKEMAKKAGISVGALRHLESGKGASIKTLIKVLRAHKKLKWLETVYQGEE